MKMYNQTNDRIGVLPKTLEVDGINLYTSRMSEEVLNEEGWFNTSYGSREGDPFYFTFIENRELVGNIYTITYTAVAKPQDAVDSAIMQSMLKDGAALTLKDDARVSVGASNTIVDRTAHNTWMNELYDSADAEIIVTPKPLPEVRQLLTIDGDAQDSFRFDRRFDEQWGYIWQLTLTRKEANNLTIGIYDENGGYLYTIGELADNGDGTFSGECPAGQATAEIEDMYFIWLLGSAHISPLTKYGADVEIYSGVVRSNNLFD